MGCDTSQQRQKETVDEPEKVKGKDSNLTHVQKIDKRKSSIQIAAKRNSIDLQKKHQSHEHEGLNAEDALKQLQKLHDTGGQKSNQTPHLSQKDIEIEEKNNEDDESRIVTEQIDTK